MLAWEHIPEHRHHYGYFCLKYFWFCIFVLQAGPSAVSQFPGVKVKLSSLL